jgi:hypothetical protein
MQPQYEAHLTSPHAEVECTQCHIAYRSGPLGPNASAYVDAKIGGMRQTLAVMTGKYDAPIRAPTDKIPHTNTTCEGCHAPEKNYGVVITIRLLLARREEQAVTRACSRSRSVAAGRGIGRHSTGTRRKVWYRAADEAPHRHLMGRR